MNILIKSVTTSVELDQVYAMTYTTFRRRGICKPRINRKLDNNKHLDFGTNTHILIAKNEEDVLGTISYTTCYQPDKLYNYQTFEGELNSEIFPNGKAYCAWRLAIKSSFSTQPLVVLLLLRAVILENIQLGNPRAYFSVVTEDVKIYQKILVNPVLLGTKRKKTEDIDGVLCYFRLDTNMENIETLNRRISILRKRLESKYAIAG